MKAKIIDGKAVAAKIKSEVKADAEIFERQNGRKIGLAVILVGDNAASKIYVRNKFIACSENNIKSFEYILPDTVNENELIDLIEEINKNKNIDGLLVQLPLPSHINAEKALAHISPKKDVDGFHAYNAGNLFLGRECLRACTPSGIIELIKSTGESISGKHAVIVGRSNIVGKPVSMMLLENNATVTICHSKTVDLAKYTQIADILVVAIGKKELIKGNMIKPGAIVIDVGMNRESDKLFGDVDFSQACDVASYITPVPGGVGPMTIAMLLSNTVKAANSAK